MDVAFPSVSEVESKETPPFGQEPTEPQKDTLIQTIVSAETKSPTVIHHKEFNSTNKVHRNEPRFQARPEPEKHSHKRSPKESKETKEAFRTMLMEIVQDTLKGPWATEMETWISMNGKCPNILKAIKNEERTEWVPYIYNEKYIFHGNQTLYKNGELRMTVYLAGILPEGTTHVEIFPFGNSSTPLEIDTITLFFSAEKAKGKAHGRVLNRKENPVILITKYETDQGDLDLSKIELPIEFKTHS